MEVVSDCAATESFGRFAQRFGRGLRVLEGKDHLVYLDHVGNVQRHGLPTESREWSLDRREKRSNGKSDAIPLRACTQCFSVFERFHKKCPFCGFEHVPARRDGVEWVDGSLVELDADTLAAMRAKVDPVCSRHPDPIVQASLLKKYREKAAAQVELRAAMANWAGSISQETDADTVDMLQRRFYLQYGCDVLSAQALSRTEADALRERIIGGVK